MDPARQEPQLFDPRARQYRFRLAVRVVTHEGVYRHIFWGRIIAAVGVALLCGWLLLTASAWAFLRYKREWHTAPYLDLVFYPIRAREFRAALGQHYIQVGRGHIQKNNFRQAHSYLMAGLRHAPDNLDARKTAAIMFVRYGLLPRALDTLAAGVKYNPDLDYLKLLFGWMLEARRDEEVLQLAQQLLPAKPTAELRHRFVAWQAAIAHHERGRYDAAEKLILEWGLVDALEGQLVLAACEWQRGLRERALQRLEGELARFGKRDELYLQVIRYYRELGRHADARRYALLRQFNDPRSPGPRIDLLHGYRATDDVGSEEREIEQYLREFGSDARAVAMLAGYAADAGRTQLLERVRAVAEAQQWPRDEFDLARVQLALIQRNYAAALEFSDPKRRAQSDGATARGPGLIDGLRIAALHATGNFAEAEGTLTSILATAQFRAHEARVLARELEAVGAPKLARVVLERLVQKNSVQDAVILGEIIRLDIAMGNRPGLLQYVPHLLATPRPPRATLEEVLLALDERRDGEVVMRVREALEKAEQSTKRGTG